MMTDTERSLLQRYAESLIEVQGRYPNLTAAGAQAVLRKVHEVWKDNEFDGRSPEFIEAAKTALSTANAIIKGEITAEVAKERCQKLWSSE